MLSFTIQTATRSKSSPLPRPRRIQRAGLVSVQNRGSKVVPIGTPNSSCRYHQTGPDGWINSEGDDQRGRNGGTPGRRPLRPLTQTELRFRTCELDDFARKE